MYTLFEESLLDVKMDNTTLVSALYLDVAWLDTKSIVVCDSKSNSQPSMAFAFNEGLVRTHLRAKNGHLIDFVAIAQFQNRTPLTIPNLNLVLIARLQICLPRHRCDWINSDLNFHFLNVPFF